jgi:hypothetical protein
MKRPICLVLLAAVLAAGVPGSGDPTGTTVPTSTVAGPAAVTEILLQATLRLLQSDTTFEDGYRFPTVLVVDRVKDGTPLSADQMAALSRAIAPLGTVEFIADRDDYINHDLRPTVEGSAIITLGPVTIVGNQAKIDMEMWCGGLCGIWLTYALETGDAGWEILGTVGPIAIS